MKLFAYILFCLLFGFSGNSEIYAQTNASKKEIHEFFYNQKIQITYREGEVIYGTYYFIEVHYCPNGYGLYGNTVKKTVLGNEQKTNWQEYGTWKAIAQNGVNGIQLQPTSGYPQFYPIYKLQNGDIFVGEGITIIKQGTATCQ
ncbi:MAG: hypothetical protein ACON5F_07365 [Jejuia sp.]